MGSLRGDNGGGQPPGGGGLPDLPPEWGTVIIPDDLSELARESAQLRRELRRNARRDRWRRRLHLPPATTPRVRDASAVGVPLLIMAIAIVATLTSLFALAWPGPAGHVIASPQAASAAAPPPRIPDVTLVAADGTPLHVRNSLPAVFLLADDCACADLEIATARQVPAGVTVLAVARTAPVLPSALPSGVRLRAAADPQGQLRATYAGSATAPGVVAILARSSGEVVRAATRVQHVSDFAADLPHLT